MGRRQGRTRKYWVSVHTFHYPQPLFGPTLSDSDLAQGVLWPYPPEVVVRFLPDHSSYLVDVEVASDDEANHYVSGIVVRSGVPTSATGTKRDPWKEGAEWNPVSPREVQRMALSTFARAAMGIAENPITPEGQQEARRILMPRGRPERGRGTGFYKDILDTSRSLEAQGIKPASEIARRKGVSPNLVHQWLFRARRLEEIAPRPKAVAGRPRMKRKRTT